MKVMRWFIFIKLEMHEVVKMPTHLIPYVCEWTGLQWPVAVIHPCLFSPLIQRSLRLRFNANVLSVLHGRLYSSHVSTVG